MLLLLFTVVRDIPRIQIVAPVMFSSEIPQLRQLLLALWPGAFSQIGEEIQYLLRILRHFCGQRFISVAVKTQELRKLMPQRQDLFHDGTVIPFTGIGALIGSAG